MRYTTKYYYINEIPVVELIDANLEDKQAPLVIFYHGFTNTKDGMMTFGNEIAKRGFRVIMPDAVHHGERRRYGESLHTNGMMFFEALMKNIEEYPDIVRFFRQKDLIKDNYIGVSGMSMGGMTTSLLFQSHETIKASVVLMGSPQQLAFNEWIIKQYVSTVPNIDALIPNATNVLEEMTQFFKKHDLGLNMKAINKRPMLLWHSKQDPVVPYHFAQEFVEQVNQIPEGKYVYLKLDEQGGHKVPYIEMARMAEFFHAAYTKTIEDIYDSTENKMNELWG